MNKPNLEARIIVYLSVDGVLIGSRGLVELLETIEETGSINKAAQKLGISYRKVWSKLRFAEMKGSVKLIESPRGRGGSKLTPEAKELIKKYKEKIRALEKHKLL